MSPEKSFVGLRNFAGLLFDDQDFWDSFRHTLFYADLTVPMLILVPLGLAVLFREKLFLWPLVVINDANKMTLTVALAFLLRGGHTITKFGDLMAGAFIATLPSIIVFVFTKRFIVRGIATQGLKE